MRVFLQIKKFGFRFHILCFGDHNTDLFLIAFKWYNFFDVPYDRSGEYHWFAFKFNSFETIYL